MSELSPDEKPEKKFRISTRTDEFLRWYRESVGMKKSEQYRFIASKLAPYFTNQEDLYYFLDKKMYCRKRAETTRRIRCLRRAALHELNYFCTFTYDGKKLTESEFEKRLLTALRHFASRKRLRIYGDMGTGRGYGSGCIFTAFSISRKAKWRGNWCKNGSMTSKRNAWWNIRKIPFFRIDSVGIRLI